MENQSSIQTQIENLEKKKNERIIELQKIRDENIKKILDEITKIQNETQNAIEKAQMEANQKIQQLKTESSIPKSAIKTRRPKNTREFSTRQSDLDSEPKTIDSVRSKPKRSSTPKKRHSGINRSNTDVSERLSLTAEF